MCTILLAWRHRPGTPIILAANRDELLARPSLDPHVLHREPLIVGGQDAVAGGTWLAVRGDGVVAAVTNRRAGDRDPTRRSRGELPLMLLTAGPDDDAALSLLRSLQPGDYNPFNALYMSPRVAVVAHAHGDSLDIRELEPGLHVLTVYDVDDGSQVKVAALTEMLRRADAEAPDLLAAMETILEERGEPGRSGVDAACIDAGDVYGTVSSSSVVVRDDGGIVYRHAPGRPCDTPRADLSALLDPSGATA
jgi:uncharacterized protein with NRDE domain